MLPLDGLSTYSLEQMSDEEFWNYARQRASVASRISSPEQDDQDQYLECKLSSGYCLLPLRAIIEVVPPPHRFARLPSTPGWMCGIAAWHGETIAVIDLDLYLSGTGNSSPDAMLLVASHAELTIGLLVPGVGQTTTVQLEQMMPATTQEDVVRGIYDGRPVLDAPALLTGVVLDLIPTGNVPSNGSCQRDCVATDCVRQARPKEVLRPSKAQPVGEVVQQIERAVHNG
jgi:chemotaxis signal transduction protein